MKNEKWLFFHSLLHDFVALLLMSLPPPNGATPPPEVYSSQGVHQVMKIQGWMYEENKLRIDEAQQSRNKADSANQKAVLKKEDFYNEVVSEYMALRTDFSNWKKQGGHVTLRALFLIRTIDFHFATTRLS